MTGSGSGTTGSGMPGGRVPGMKSGIVGGTSRSGNGGAVAGAISVTLLSPSIRKIKGSLK